MSIVGGPDIVNDGLILYLDAGNTKSYPGSGTTWTDLSNEKNHATLSNFTVGSLNGGTLTADGANSFAIVNAAASLQPIAITIEVMCKPLYNAQNYTNVISYPPNDDNHESPYMIYAIYLQHIGSAYSTGSATSGPLHSRIRGEMVTSIGGLYDFGVWNHLVISFDNQLVKYYRDGVLKDTDTVSSSSISYSGYENQNVFIGVNPSGAEDFEGEYSNIRLYNRALTDKEILQNFNALKGRFGL